MSTSKFIPTKKFYLVADLSNQVVSVKQDYGDAVSTTKLIPGGHILEVVAKRLSDALRFASRDHGYRPSPYLVGELGIDWKFTFHLVSTRDKTIIEIHQAKADASKACRRVPGSYDVEIVAGDQMEACEIAATEFGFEISHELMKDLAAELETE